jgi:hypothetical protein
MGRLVELEFGLEAPLECRTAEHARQDELLHVESTVQRFGLSQKRTTRPDTHIDPPFGLDSTASV